MSANEHPDTVFECIRAGAEDYLLKPLTKKEVQYIWQHVWRRKHQPAVRIPPPLPQEQVCLLTALVPPGSRLSCQYTGRFVLQCAIVWLRAGHLGCMFFLKLGCLTVSD